MPLEIVDGHGALVRRVTSRDAAERIDASVLQAADARPAMQAREAVPALERTLAALEARWAALRERRDAGR